MTELTNTTSNPSSDPKIGVLQRMYDAFGRGDVDAVLAEVANDVEWIAVSEEPSPTVPWYGAYHGKAEVPRFFKEIGSSVEVTGFEPLSFTTSDTDVMVALRWAFTVRSTGKHADLHMQHWWRFAGGKVVAVRTAEDSAQTAAAFV